MSKRLSRSIMSFTRTIILNLLMNNPIVENCLMVFLKKWKLKNIYSVSDGRSREIDHEQTMSTSKTFIKRDFYKFFKNDLKQLREVKPPGKASLHMSFHSFTIRKKYFQEMWSSRYFTWSLRSHSYMYHHRNWSIKRRGAYFIFPFIGQLRVKHCGRNGEH